MDSHIKGRLVAARWNHPELEKCVDCGTEYPVIRGRTMCNGVQIAWCPWCREDSQPWTHGRGV